MKINKKTIAVIAAIVAVAVVIPNISSAQGLTAFLTAISGWLTTVGKLLFTAAALVFFWGLVKFIYQPEDTEKGKNLMIWGLIAIFVMFSIWSIIKWLQKTTGTDTGGLTPPAIPTP